MERIKHDVEHLIGLDFQDADALDVFLGTRLGPVRSDDGIDIRTAVGGSLAGLPLENVELRSAPGDSSRATLLLDFVAPGPAFDSVPWPDAVAHPPRPDAPDSTAYWSLQVDAAKVTLSLSQDRRHLSYIAIRKR